MPTIIDGYNLIFTCGLEGKSRTPQSLEKARARLISTFAANVGDQERSGTTIVFDAKRLPIKETEADSIVQDIRILYAVDYEDADSLIEELITTHSTPKKLTVVSSDHRIQTAATRRRATAVDSDVWYDQLLEQRANDTLEPQPSSDKDAAIKSLQSTDWANEFGSIDTSEPADPTPETRSDSQPPSFNPFPPGYGEDLLD